LQLFARLLHCRDLSRHSFILFYKRGILAHQRITLFLQVVLPCVELIDVLLQLMLDLRELGLCFLPVRSVAGPCVPYHLLQLSLICLLSAALLASQLLIAL